MNKQVTEQTIYFPLFAEQSFFFTKKHSPHPPPPAGIKWSAPYFADFEIVISITVTNTHNSY